jgi:hypothetical protein
MSRDTTAWQVLSVDPGQERILKMVTPAVSVVPGGEVSGSSKSRLNVLKGQRSKCIIWPLMDNFCV